MTGVNGPVGDVYDAMGERPKVAAPVDELLSCSEILGDIKRIAVAFSPVGSRVTCSPPPMNTDADYLVLVDKDSVDAVRTIVLQNFEHDGSDMTDIVLSTPEDQQFTSYSDGEINVILTESAVFYRRFIAATSVAKRLNLLDKVDRIALFQAVLYGNADATLACIGGAP